MPVDREPAAHPARQTSPPVIPATLSVVGRLTNARHHARTHGSVLVSRTAPRTDNDGLTFRCANGHTWIPTWAAVRIGRWWRILGKDARRGAGAERSPKQGCAE